MLQGRGSILKILEGGWGPTAGCGGVGALNGGCGGKPKQDGERGDGTLIVDGGCGGALHGVGLQKCSILLSFKIRSSWTRIFHL